MKLNRKAIVAAAIIASAASFSAPSAFAAGADSFSDVPKDHWAYEALDYLAKEGVVDGYTDGTFEGNRTMSRYEMAAIVYKACQNENISIGGRAVLDKLRAEYDAEIKQLNTRVDKVEKDVEEMQKFGVKGFFRVQYAVDANSNPTGNKRFFAELVANYKVNDNWTAHFQEEYNAHYANGNIQRLGHASGNDADDALSKREDASNGIQRLWVEGQADNGNWIKVGRAWQMLGFQTRFLGTETDGVMAGIKLNSNGLTATPFVVRDCAWDNKDTTAYGLQIQGPVGHNFDITAAYARSKSELAPTDNGHAFNVGIATNIAKNLRLTSEYMRVNNDANQNGASWNFALNYKGINLQDKGSFGMFLNYMKNGHVYGLMNNGDDADGFYKRNQRMLVLGASYVPAKNIEWKTQIGFGKHNIHDGGNHQVRNFFDTRIDFHF